MCVCVHIYIYICIYIYIYSHTDLSCICVYMLLISFLFYPVLSTILSVATLGSENSWSENRIPKKFLVSQ